MSRNSGIYFHANNKADMYSWKHYKLGGLAAFSNGKSRPDTSVSGSVPIYGGNGILGYTYMSNTSGDEVIIIGRVGAYCGSVYFENRPIWVSDNAIQCLSNKDNMHSRYLYYLLIMLDLNTYAEGSSHPLLTQRLLNDVDVIIPISIEEQKAIASILSSLDDKIKLLHRQNQALEALAETIFRQWFFKEIESNLNMGKLGDFIEIFDGKRIPLSKMEREKMKEGKLFPYYGAASILDYINDFIFDGDYILMGEDGTVQTDKGHPVLQRVKGQFWANNHAHVLKAKPPYTNDFIYTYLSKTIISNIVTGAVQPKINQANLKSIPFPEFPLERVNRFNSLAKMLNMKTENNNNQIRTLEKLRDTLLPKLMSGVVRVDYDKDEVEKVI